MREMQDEIARLKEEIARKASGQPRKKPRAKREGGGGNSSAPREKKVAEKQVVEQVEKVQKVCCGTVHRNLADSCVNDRWCKEWRKSS